MTKGITNKTVSLNHVQSIAVTAVMIALTYVFTAFVNIRLPVMAKGGLIHLGNIPLFLASIIFGWKVGMIAGGVGMALFDVTSGWTIWAPFTLIVAGLMGFVTGKISENKNTYGRNAIALIFALVIKVVGYYVAEWILYGNMLTPVSSIPGNIIQIVIAGVVVLPVSVRLSEASSHIFNQ
ncbi:MAG: ECF transporter S component [Lachnospiraceae bacterium]|nr:ECF transporter S component [Lachnospiraceae bacterium]